MCIRDRLERAHTLVDQMTDQVASMNRTIGELRSELKTAKAKQAVADIDAKAATQTSQTKWPKLWLTKPQTNEYDKLFSSSKVSDWLGNVPYSAVNKAAKNRNAKGNIRGHSDNGSCRFGVQHKKVLYVTPYFPSYTEAVMFRRQLFRAFDVTPEVYL